MKLFLSGDIKAPFLWSLFLMTSSLGVVSAQEITESLKTTEPTIEGVPEGLQDSLREALESGDHALSEAQIRQILSNGNIEITPSQTLGKKDYTEAFQKIIDLGFPDAKGAKYVNLTFAEKETKRRVSYNRIKIERKGNAWILPPQDPKSPTRVAIYDANLTAKVASKEKRNLIVRLFAGDDDKTRNGILKAEWTEIDPAEEVKTIIEQLENDAQISQVFDADRWSYDRSSLDLLGKLLMTACHLHRAGHPVEGNKLARVILTRAPYPFKVIDHVIEQLAEKEYQVLLDSLYSNPDWKTFLAGIRQLKTKYPRGWSDQPGLNILIPQVIDFIAKGEEKIQPFKGTKLNPKITATLEHLLTSIKPGERLMAYAPSCWLINPLGEIESDYNQSGPGPAWVTAMITKGLDSLPSLIAASADATLIAAPFSGGSRNDQNSWNSFDSGQGSNGDLAVFDQMNRPCSRGEVVRAILINAFPAGSLDWSSLSPEEFQLSAYDWWTENKGKSATELAMLYLKNGDRQQNPIAIQVMLARGDLASFSAIEDFILNSDSLFSTTDLAKQYLQKRRAKGKKFYESYLAALTEQIAERYSDEDSKERYQEYLEKAKTSLSILVNEVSPAKIMAEISSGKQSVEKGFQMLQVAMGEDACRENLDILIPFIAKLEKTEDRLQGLRQLQQWAYQGTPREAYTPSEEEGELNDFQKKSRQLAHTHFNHWLVLLKRKDSLEVPPEILSNFQSPPSEAHLAASTINSIYFPETSYRLQAINLIATSEEVWTLLLERIETFTTTGEIPALPDSELVAKDRQEALLAKLKSLPARELIAYRKTLAISERMALSEIIAELEEIPKNLTALANICQSIDWSRGGGVSAVTRKKIENTLLEKELDASLIETIFQTLSTDESSLMIFFQSRGASIEGPSILIADSTMTKSWLENYIPDDSDKLDGEKVNSLDTIVVFGLEESSREPKTAVRFQPPLDEAKEKEAYDVLLKQGLALFEPVEGNDEEESGAGFAIASVKFDSSEEENRE